MSSISSLTASQPSTPERPPYSPPLEHPIQPDHFYSNDSLPLPPSTPPTAHSTSRPYLSPDDDPLASRGIPVFKPTMDEFIDFELYMTRIERWGRRSGIVKVIPPKEWRDNVQDIKPQLAGVKIKSPIEQCMRGRAGLFRVENMEKRKVMSVREWAELCAKEEYQAPGVSQVGVHHNPNRKQRREKQVKQDATAQDRRVERAHKDASFAESFSPHTDWLPHDTTADDYTPEFCAKLERAFWRNCGLGKPAWYGADTMGSLFTNSTSSWNVASLPSTLSRLLPKSQGLPGVNTPYLYFGMWRASFAWHVEDMDLFSINYIHFGAPKFWYAVPQGRATALENTMRGYFPKDVSNCPQFLRHKAFLASPTLLAQSSVRPNHLVQHAGEFVITYPRGYHAGFNLGLNCAESVNFALDSWLDEGRKAGICQCVDFSVRINVDQLLEDRRMDALERADPRAADLARATRNPVMNKEVQENSETLERTTTTFVKHNSPRKRKPAMPFEPIAASKRPRTASLPLQRPVESTKSSLFNHGGPGPRITLKLGPPPPLPKPSPSGSYPCCVCVDPSTVGLVRVHDLPALWRELCATARLHYRADGKGPGAWMIHQYCAMVLPETWVDQIAGERVAFGLDGIVRGRWSLKCSVCTHPNAKGHGALIQCAKGKCPKSFHVNCARDGQSSGIRYNIRDVDKEVVLVEPASYTTAQLSTPPDVRVLKVIKKIEVEAYCPQHNPILVAERRASKQDALKAEILSLPLFSRVKIRVSSGLFEVTLIRVLEEKQSVQVLWAANEVREVRWANLLLASNTSAHLVEVPTLYSPTINDSSETQPPVQPLGQYWTSQAPSYPNRLLS
ncbi:Specific transcriptional repressor [Mycena indigotica]|uniref:Specific transcriptional repressor n=1 Tax=Mycena indigotica TaxID=2126181 RepID=A0A8H6RZD6_9AGAR|nr:Specific transcriptional repressor [Mycena indigotica]KAF7290510.1 Specific transcriptional repressor [Mycena indigotica]